MWCIQLIYASLKMLVKLHVKNANKIKEWSNVHNTHITDTRVHTYAHSCEHTPPSPHLIVNLLTVL